MIKNIFRNPFNFFSELFAVWRILLVVTTAQLIGGGVSAVFSYYGEFFIDFWIGGVYSTPVGFALGYLWQRKVDVNKHEKHKQFIALMGVITILLLLFALFFPLKESAKQIKRSESSESIQQIPK